MFSDLEFSGPAAILIILIGSLWAALAAVAMPPPPGRFPRLLLAAIVGAILGQAAAVATHRQLVPLGDVQLIGVSLGAFLAIGIGQWIWR